MPTAPPSPSCAEQAKQPRVAIIVVTYNGLKDTLACMKSLKGLAYKNLKVVLVDQHSADGTPAAIRDQFPWVLAFFRA